ncbi:hypothetical protein JB92DRAFT_742577 [Gautieria morchelliformis]|nr:hypothetical protein JB92DRAFT_742577 [Gautieria morchelliformis]
MLRVGQSLSQSAPDLFQASCKVLPWVLLPCSPMSSQVRPMSHTAAAKLHPTDEANATQTLPDEEEPQSVPRRETTTGWKDHFLCGLRIRKPIHVLRLPQRRLPPRQEQQATTVMEPDSNQKSSITIHPIHWPSNLKADSEGPRPPVGPLRAAHKSRDNPRSRVALLDIISGTQSASEAWEAYNTLISVRKPRVAVSNNVEGSTSQNGCDELTIPYPHLHRLARLLSSTRPRTRQLFLRLLSVLTTLRSTGGPIFMWEWNALINCAGKGWRKTNVEDYRAALGIFQDMVTSNQVAASSSGPRHEPSEWRDMLPADRLPVEQPDIITFTTLLDIASRTLNDQAIHHALSLLAASELPWNNVTHMARLPYYIHTNQLRAVRGILLASVTRGLDLITLNGCLWAYAYRGRLRMVMQVYDLLRRNIPAEDRIDFGESDPSPFSLDPTNHTGANDRDENPFVNIKGFVSQATMAPDSVTYALLIQALCYHGDLIGALTVFRDMVSTVDPALRPPGSHRHVQSAYFYTPTYAIYRAIFLGFARHANKTSTLANSLISQHQGIDTVPLKEFASRLTASPTAACPSPLELAAVTPWSLESLNKIFERFMEMHWEPTGTNAGDPTAPPRPNDRMIYWIMVAYAKTTNRDIKKMFDVWKRLDARFGYESNGEKLGGRLGRIDRELEELQRQDDSVYAMTT